jgi:hypothetical protein
VAGAGVKQVTSRKGAAAPRRPVEWLGAVASVRRCREARWFIDGDVPESLQPHRRPAQRTDLYELGTLRPWQAHKRRGRAGVIEHKLRVGRVELIELLDVDGYAETWEKCRDGKPPPAGPYLEVRKQLWITGGIEIGRFEVDGAAGWTLCVDVDRRLNATTRATFEAWVPLLQTAGVASSYPAWLTERHSRRSSP